MADPVGGITVSALMVGPCSLEFSKMKALDHYQETSQCRRNQLTRASIAGGFMPTSPKTPLPSLNIKRTESLGAEEIGQVVCSSARDYAACLHQNLKSTLLYGKNNVNMFLDENETPMGGYLALNQNSDGSLIIKWTPNELMSSSRFDFIDKSQYYKYSMHLNVRDMVYLHCHSKSHGGGNVVFVGADGVQHPPLHFPSGRHMLSFLSSLETGLLPRGHLDPPLWSQRGKGGKSFPKLPRQSQSLVTKSSVEIAEEEAANLDYVFRILPCGDADLAAPRVPHEIVPPKKNAAVNNTMVANGDEPPSSRLVKMSSLSSRLKQRLGSLSSSSLTDGASPPETPFTSASSRSASTTTPPPEHFFDAKCEFPSETERSTSASLTSTDEPNACDSPSRKTLQNVCDSMRHQILCRAFYGWLAHCRHLKTIRNHLAALVNETIIAPDIPTDAQTGLTEEIWSYMKTNADTVCLDELFRLVYYGGVQPSLRVQVWPFLLGLYEWNVNGGEHDNGKKLADVRLKYENLMAEWTALEAIVREHDREAFTTARESTRISVDVSTKINSTVQQQHSLTNDVFVETDDEQEHDTEDEDHWDECSGTTSAKESNYANGQICRMSVASGESGFISQDSVPSSATELTMEPLEPPQSLPYHKPMSTVLSSEITTPEEGDGGVYTKELLDVFALNLHRVERDVHRCDRNYYYYSNETNLEKLKNVMCTYVWEHLDVGYVQGMCDLAAPLLVTFDDEILTYGCFSLLMQRMTPNFAHGGGMDANLANMRSLLQAMDPEFYDFVRRNGDYTHFYFCYRWFLLDFKREFVYEDVFHVWETIWASEKVSSKNFGLFLALALMETYRDIIIDNNMDFTDIIKFFNETAEKHEAKVVLKSARDLVYRLQTAVENDCFKKVNETSM